MGLDDGRLRRHGLLALSAGIAVSGALLTSVALSVIAETQDGSCECQTGHLSSSAEHDGVAIMNAPVVWPRMSLLFAVAKSTSASAPENVNTPRLFSVASHYDVLDVSVS